MPTLPLFRDGADYRLAKVEIGGQLQDAEALAFALATAAAFGHQADVARCLVAGQSGIWPEHPASAARVAADAKTWCRAIAEKDSLEVWLCGPDVRPDLACLLRDLTQLGLGWRCLLPEGDIGQMQRSLFGIRLPPGACQQAETLLASLAAKSAVSPIEWGICGSLPGPPLVLHAKLDRRKQIQDEVAISAGQETPLDHVHACQRLLRHGPGKLLRSIRLS